MLKITRLTPRLCSVERIIIKSVRNKYSKGEVIHRLMKEQKQCYGALLETKSQKEKRLKLEKKGRIAPITEPNVDSELSWMLKNAKLRYVQVSSNPVEKQSKLGETPKKVILVKTTNKHEQESFDAAESILLKLENRTYSPKTDKKITKSQVLVQKKIVKRRSDIAKSEIAKKNSKTMIISQPDDEISKNIYKVPLYYDEEENCPDIWNSKQILSISKTADNECMNYPSVTRILNATMSEEAKRMLERWMARMIRELGQDGFDTYKADLLENGKLLHSAIDMTLRKKPVEIPLGLKNCYDSLKNILKELENVKAIESHVVHRDLNYRGIIDCVATYKGNLCLIDWKKSDNQKIFLSSTYDAPLQIASYIGALNADKNYPFQIKSGLLVIAYSLGDTPTLHPIVGTELQYYWERWLERLAKYRAMQNT